MPFFAYKARNARGDLIEGIQEGADSAAVADMLFNNGVTPVEIAVSAKGPGAQGESRLDRIAAAENHLRGCDAVFAPDVHPAQGGCADHARPGRVAGIHP